MIHTYSERLIKQIVKRREEYNNRVISGACRTLEDYRHITGRIHGLDEVEALIRELHKAYYPGLPININEGKHNVEPDIA